MGLFELGKLNSQDDVYTGSSGANLSLKDGPGFAHSMGVSRALGDQSLKTSLGEDAYNTSLSALSGLAGLGQGLTAGTLGMALGKNPTAPFWEGAQEFLADAKTKQQKAISEYEQARVLNHALREEAQRMQDRASGDSETMVSLKSLGREFITSAQDTLNQSTGSLLNQGGEVAAQLMGLGMLGKGVSKLGALAGGAKVANKVLPKGVSGTGAAMGALDAISVVGDAQASAEQNLANMSAEDWAKSPEYQALTADLMREGASPEYAHEQAVDTLTRKYTRTAGLNAIPEALAAGYIMSKMDRLGHGNPFKAVPATMAKEAAEETIQDFGANAGNILAADEVLGNKELAGTNLGTGLGQSAVLGALGGGMGHVGAMGSAMRQNLKQYKKDKEEQKEVSEQIAQAEAKQAQADVQAYNNDVDKSIEQGTPLPETAQDMEEAQSIAQQAPEAPVAEATSTSDVVPPKTAEEAVEASQKAPKASLEDLTAEAPKTIEEQQATVEQKLRSQHNVAKKIDALSKAGDAATAVKVERNFNEFAKTVTLDQEDVNLLPESVRTSYEKEPVNSLELVKPLLDVAKDSKASEADRLKAEVSLLSIQNNALELADKGNNFMQNALRNPELGSVLGESVQATQTGKAPLRVQALVNADMVNHIDEFVANFNKKENVSKEDIDLLGGVLFSAQKVQGSLFNEEELEQASNKVEQMVKVNPSIMSDEAKVQFAKARAAINMKNNTVLKGAREELMKTKQGMNVHKNALYKDKGEYTSFRTHIRHVESSMKKGDEAGVESNLAQAGNFVQHQVNKSMAMLNALATFNKADTGSNKVESVPYAFEAFSPITGSFTSVRENQKMNSAPGTIALTNAVVAETQQMVASYNAMVAMNPGKAEPIEFAITPEQTNLLEHYSARANAIWNKNQKAGTTVPVQEAPIQPAKASIEAPKVTASVQAQVAPMKPVEAPKPMPKEEASVQQKVEPEVKKEAPKEPMLISTEDFDYAEPIINEPAPVKAQPAVKEAKVEPVANVPEEVKIHPTMVNAFSRVFKTDAKAVKSVPTAMESPEALNKAFKAATGKDSKTIQKVPEESMQHLQKHYFNEAKVAQFSSALNKKINEAISKDKGVQAAVKDMADGVDISHRPLAGVGHVLALVSDVKKNDDGSVSVTLDEKLVRDAYTASVMALMTAEASGRVDESLDALEGAKTTYWKSDAVSPAMRREAAKAVPLEAVLDEATRYFKNISGLKTNSDISETESDKIIQQLVGSALYMASTSLGSIGSLQKFSAKGGKDTIEKVSVKGNEVVMEAEVLPFIAQARLPREQLVFMPARVVRDDHGEIADPAQKAVKDAKYALKTLGSLGSAQVDHITVSKDSTDTLPVPQQIKHSGGTALPEGSKKAVANRQAVEYKKVDNTATVLRNMGHDFFMELFGEPLTEADAETLNPAYVASAEGKNVNMSNAYNHAMALAQELEDAGEDATMHFAYQVNMNGRLQMVGSANPQANKTIRETVSAVQSDIDLTQEDMRFNYAMGLGQALGVKVHNLQPDASKDTKDTYRDLLKEIAGKVKTVKALMEVLENPNKAMIEAQIEAIKSEQSEGTLLELSAMTDVAQLMLDMGKSSKDLTEADLTHLVQTLFNKASAESMPKKFKTHMYVEADGVTNGPAMATALTLTADAMESPHTMKALNRSGFALTMEGEAQSLADVRAKHAKAEGDASKAEDAYEEVTSIERDGQNEISDVVASTGNSGLIALRRMVMDLFRYNHSDIKMEANPSTGIPLITSIKRNLAKNPLTVFLYGSGGKSISTKILEGTSVAKGITANFYYGLAQAQRRVKKEGGEISDWMYFDYFKKQGQSDAEAKKNSKLVCKRVAYILAVLTTPNPVGYATEKGFREASLSSMIQDEKTHTPLLKNSELKWNEAMAKDYNFQNGNLVIEGPALENLRNNFYNLYGASMKNSLEQIFPSDMMQCMDYMKTVPNMIQSIGRYAKNLLESDARVQSTGKDTWELSKNEKQKLQKDLEKLELNIPGLESTVAVRADKALGGDTRSEAIAVGGFQPTLNKPVEGDIGVGALSAMVQGMGDATIMHKASDLPATTDIFDGMNISLANLNTQGERMNEAVIDATKYNPMLALLDQFDKLIDFLSSHPEILETMRKDQEEAMDLKLVYHNYKKNKVVNQITPELVSDAASGKGLFAKGAHPGARRFVLMHQNTLENSTLDKSWNALELFYNTVGRYSTVDLNDALGLWYSSVAQKAIEIEQGHRVLQVAGFSSDQMAAGRTPASYQSEEASHEAMRKEALKAVDPSTSYIRQQRDFASSIETQLTKSGEMGKIADKIDDRTNKVRDKLIALEKKLKTDREAPAKAPTMQAASDLLKKASFPGFKQVMKPMQHMLTRYFNKNDALVFQGTVEEFQAQAENLPGISDAQKAQIAGMTEGTNGAHLRIGSMDVLFVNSKAPGNMGEHLMHEALHAITYDITNQYFSNAEKLDPSVKEAADHVMTVAHKFQNMKFSKKQLANNNSLNQAKYYADMLLDPNSSVEEKATAFTEFVSYAMSNDYVNAKLSETQADKSLSDRLKGVYNALKAWVTRMLMGNHINGLDKDELTHLRYDIARFMAYNMHSSKDPSGPKGGRVSFSKSYSEQKTEKLMKKSLAKFPLSKALFDNLELHREAKALNKIAEHKENELVAVKQFTQAQSEALSRASEAASLGLLNTEEAKMAYQDAYLTFANPMVKDSAQKALNEISTLLDNALPNLKSHLTPAQYNFLSGTGVKGHKNLNMVALALSSPAISEPLDLMLTEETDSFDSVSEVINKTRQTVLQDLASNEAISYAATAKQVYQQVAQAALRHQENNTSEFDPESTAPVSKKNLLNHVISLETQNEWNEALVKTKDTFVEELSKLIPNKLIKEMIGAFHSNTDAWADRIHKYGLSKIDNLTSMALLRDLTGRTESNAKVFDLLKEAKHWVASKRQYVKDGMISYINQAWEGQFKTSKEAREAYTQMTQALIATDVVNVGANVDEAVEILSDPTKIPAKIAKLEQQLQALNPKFAPLWIQKSQELAQFMNTKKPALKLLRNALAIANLYGYSQHPSMEQAKAAQELVDQLTSLYAYDGLPSSLKNKMKTLTLTNKEGMKKTLGAIQMMNVNGKEIINPNEYKGYVPRQSKYGEIVTIANRGEGFKLIHSGYIEAGKVKLPKALEALGFVPLYYYYAPRDPKGAWQTQILQTSAQTHRGIDLKTGVSTGGNTVLIQNYEAVKELQKMHDVDLQGLIPVFSQTGSIIAYEMVLDTQALDQATPMLELPEIVGTVRSRIMEEKLARAFNAKAYSVIHDMGTQGVSEGRAKEYIDLLDKDAIKTLPVTLQEGAWMQYKAIKTWCEQTGHNHFPVRRDMLEDVLGYRNASVGDIFTGASNLPPKVRSTIRTALMTVLGSEGVQYLLGMEKGWQRLGSEVRKTIVIRSMSVPAVNSASNVLQLYSRGVSPLHTLKAFKESWKELELYRKLYNQKIEIMSQPDPTPAHKSQLERINERIQSLKIYPLIEQGELGTIANLGASEAELGIFKGKYLEKVSDLIEEMPKPVQALARYGYLSEDTPLYKFLECASQYGDFIAKYALYTHMKQAGASEQEALDAIKTEFCYYDQSPGRVRGYLESMNSFWFGNYKLRSIKVGLNMLTRNPLTTITSQNIPFTNEMRLGTPVDDNAISKLFEGTLGYSIGPGMITQGIDLNPWVNAIES